MESPQRCRRREEKQKSKPEGAEEAECSEGAAVAAVLREIFAASKDLKHVSDCCKPIWSALIEAGVKLQILGHTPAISWLYCVVRFCEFRACW
jgi:hypothetical protein